MTDLAEFVSDFFQTIDRRSSNREIAEAYIEQNGDGSRPFEEQVDKLLPQVAYYTGRES